MIKLNSNYNRVLPILNKVPFNHLFATVAVEGKVDGQIYVDHELEPTVCLIVHKYGMALLCGNHESEFFNNSLIGFLNNDSLNNNYAKWLLTYPDDWDKKIDLFNANILQIERVNFKFNSGTIIDKIKIPNDMMLRKINKDIYEKIEGSVVPQSFWNSAEDFLENGIGYVLLKGDELISFCFSSFIVDNKLELGIETVEKYRNKGYSILVAAKMIEFCLNYGFEPVWACRDKNIGSFKLAERVGFSPSSYHRYYCIGSNYFE
jgi:hypothetical protein